MLFTASNSGSKLTLLASGESDAPYINFSADLFPTDPDGVVNPPVNPSSPGSPNPPLPTAYQPPGYTTPNFDPDLLPRLTTQPSDSLLTAVETTQFLINGTDYGDHVLSADYARPIAGAGTGQVRLNCFVQGSPLTITYDTFKPGMRFQWFQCWKGVCRRVQAGWLIKAPKIDTSDTNLVTCTLELGDELELFANRHQEPDRLYCGRAPKTAGEAARIYATYNRLKTTSYPVGHALIEPPQKFVNETPWDFLQLLYSPVNHDVRCSKTGFIEVVNRPTYNPDLPNPTLSHLSVLETPTEFTNRYKPYTRVRVTNQFLEVGDFTPKIRTRKTTNGNPENTNPWFQNGYTETITTTYTVGGTLTYSKEEFYGYVPTTFPVPKSETSTDACDTSTLETEFRLITTKTYAATYSPHQSGAYLVHKKENWLDGLKVYDDPTDSTQYLLYDGPQEYSVEHFTNVAQINNKVCAKDYLHYKLRVEKQEFKLNDTNELILVSNSLETYRANGRNPGETDFYIGPGQIWERFYTQGSIDDESGLFINQPVQNEIDVTPPNSEWIRPNTRDIQAFLEYESPYLTRTYDEATSPPVSAPCCFRRSHLATFADRYLREQYGLANAITVTIPFRFNLVVGTIIEYQHSDGTVLPYLVYAEETNQTGNVATRSLTLIRTY